MSAEKQKFFEQIRKDSNYSNLRNLVVTIYAVGCCLIMLFFALFIILLCSSNRGFNAGEAFIFLLCFGSGSFISLKIWYETILVLIDIADSNLHSAYVNHATYLQTSKRTKDA